MNRETACKICGGPAPVVGWLDLNRHCAEDRIGRLPDSGVPVYYHRCGRCGFLFTRFFDDKSAAWMAGTIYNADYARVDPDFVDARPRSLAAGLAARLAGLKQGTRFVDYGAGSGLMAELLRRDGFDIVAYDPFMGGGTEVPRGSADAVLCFEVLEHTPTPVETCRDILSFLKPDGSVLFSTLLQPADIEARGYDWWYVRPRNGHVSIHTLPSLSMLWSRVGCRLASDQTSVHIAFRDDQSLLHAWTGASTAA